MQIKGKNSVSTYLTRSIASSTESPTTTIQHPLERAHAFVKYHNEPYSQNPNVAERIVAYVKEKGPTDTVSVVSNLKIGIDEGVNAMERLERFGLVSINREGGKITISTLE